MSVFRISGVWKSNNVITHYAIHTVLADGGITRAAKRSKAEALTLLGTPGNSATTWVWNYIQAAWNIGETVQIIQGANERFLRSNPDNRLTDNLGHLINFDWIAP